MDNSKKSLLVALGVLIMIIVIIGIVGIIAFRPEKETLTGEVEAAEYRVSGKVPGRVAEVYFEEGQKVKEGDTLMIVNSPEVEAKMEQAKAARSAASAQNRKAAAGARTEQINSAYEMWQKALTGQDIAKKSYDRVKNLYEKQVISAQKYDEVEAQYKAAVATANAAKNQYDLALKGAQVEDKMAAAAMVSRADGAIQEVESYMNERFIIAPATGEIVEVFPKKGELVGTGAPLMSILDMNDIWFTFCVREDLLKDMKVGNTLKVHVPAIDKDVNVKITAIRQMASYATWRATKTNDGYDVKSFEVKMVPTETVKDLRPGMTVLIRN